MTTTLAKPDWQDQQVERLLVVPASGPFLDGHFPGQPILPGVMQLHWVMTHVQSLVPCQLQRVVQLKFVSPIKPPCQLRLQLRLRAEKVNFHFYLGEQLCSSGQLILTLSV